MRAVEVEHERALVDITLERYSMIDLRTAYIVMVYIVMACIVMDSYGLYTRAQSSASLERYSMIDPSACV